MPATKADVEHLIQEALPDAEAEIEEKNNRVFGTIVWSGFADMPVEERNRYITKVVRDRLGYKGTNLGFLLPLASRDED